MTNTHRLWLSLFAIVALVTMGTVAVRHASADGQQPAFLFPWQHGDTWLTGTAGFHYTNDALDFFPPDTDSSWEVHCEGDPNWVYEQSSYWILASAQGTVVYADVPYVLLDHGGGWFSRYYHLDAPQVTVGQSVVAGQRLGHPSTRGDCTTGPHVHFWVQGPNGETTKSVALSGIPTTNLGVNEPHPQTNNYDPGGPPPPTATPTPTATPLPTITPTLGPPTPTPRPIPGVFEAGDANCDGLVMPTDAILILQFAAGITSSDCAATHSETDCDGTITVGDAMAVLQLTLNPLAAPAAACAASIATPTPTPEPTTVPTSAATPEATPEPTAEPTLAPTAELTLAPTDTPVPIGPPVSTVPTGPTPGLALAPSS